MTDFKDKIRVMIVDDSAVIRGMVTKALQESPAVEVVASVMNGKAALNLIKEIKPDIVLLDIEMPEMDGITALPLLLEASPSSKVIMVSSLTQRNAEITMKALQLGATECVAKPTSKGDRSETDKFFRELLNMVVTLGNVATKNITPRFSAGQVPPVASTGAAKASMNVTPSSGILFMPSAEIRCLAIGSSTGGPQALMQLFKLMQSKPLKVPVFITQHMPATFTKILADHLHGASGMPCEEGADKMEAKAGTIYIAPGDYHMIPRMEDKVIRIGLNQNAPVNFCRPAVDPMFEALAKLYGRNLLAVVLTGMGQDGMEGAKVVNAMGGNVIAQDEATSVVWGMPGAVTKAGQAKAVLPLAEIAQVLMRVLP
jgi:two-component system chemotaxis response regulator CheB